MSVVDTARWARQLLVAIHVPILLSPIVFTMLSEPRARSWPGGLTLVALSTAVAALQA